MTGWSYTVVWKCTCHNSEEVIHKTDATFKTETDALKASFSYIERAKKMKKSWHSGTQTYTTTLHAPRGT